MRFPRVPAAPCLARQEHNDALYMQPDPAVIALRHWFAEQFAAQVMDGRPAIPPSL